MVRGWSAVLGVGLVVLWIAGLGNPAAASWLSWLDGVAAFCAFLISGLTVKDSERTRMIAGPVFLSLFLFTLWVIGLATQTVAWQTWWTFAFGAAFLFVGISMGSARAVRPSREEEKEEDHFRKSA